MLSAATHKFQKPLGRPSAGINQHGSIDFSAAIAIRAIRSSWEFGSWYPDRGVCVCGECTHLDVDMLVQRLWAGMCIWGRQSIWCDKMSGFLFLSFKGFLCDQDALFYFPPFHQLLSVCEQLPQTFSMPFQVPTHRDSLSRENGLEVKPLHLNSSALRSVPVWPQTRHSGSLHISSPSGK